VTRKNLDTILLRVMALICAALAFMGFNGIVHSLSAWWWAPGFWTSLASVAGLWAVSSLWRTLTHREPNPSADDVLREIYRLRARPGRSRTAAGDCDHWYADGAHTPAACEICGRR
jgi:hypothetical protein